MFCIDPSQRDAKHSDASAVSAEAKEAPASLRDVLALNLDIGPGKCIKYVPSWLRAVYTPILHAPS